MYIFSEQAQQYMNQPKLTCLGLLFASPCCFTNDIQNYPTILSSVSHTYPPLTNTDQFIYTMCCTPVNYFREIQSNPWLFSYFWSQRFKFPLATIQTTSQTKSVEEKNFSSEHSKTSRHYLCNKNNIINKKIV